MDNTIFINIKIVLLVVIILAALIILVFVVRDLLINYSFSGSSHSVSRKKYWTRKKHGRNRRSSGPEIFISDEMPAFLFLFAVFLGFLSLILDLLTFFFRYEFGSLHNINTVIFCFTDPDL